ncbi:MAG: polysaccharide deacetylase family protein [Crocinitomicaceae bacterium]
MYLFKTPFIFRWIFPRKVWGVSASKQVCLTFDDGPTKELTRWILNELRKENIKATFFCVGENAKNHPELMDEMRSAGHIIGNHTMRHENGTKTSKQAYFKSISEAEPFTSSTVFRPPYGRLPISFINPIKHNYKIVMWSWLSYDYDHSVSVDKILSKAEKIKSGDILVLHDNAKVEERIKIILPKLIQLLKAKGFEFGVIQS